MTPSEMLCSLGYVSLSDVQYPVVRFEEGCVYIRFRDRSVGIMVEEGIAFRGWCEFNKVKYEMFGSWTFRVDIIGFRLAIPDSVIWDWFCPSKILPMIGIVYKPGMYSPIFIGNKVIFYSSGVNEFEAWLIGNRIGYRYNGGIFEIDWNRFCLVTGGGVRFGS